MDVTFKTLCQKKSREIGAAPVKLKTDCKSKPENVQKSTPKRKRQSSQSGRNRTPSGLVIAPKVGTITAYLEKAKKVKIRRTSDHDKSDTSYEDMSEQFNQVEQSSQVLQALMSDASVDVHAPMSTDDNNSSNKERNPDKRLQLSQTGDDQTNTISMVKDTKTTDETDEGNKMLSINPNNILQRVDEHIKKLQDGGAYIEQQAMDSATPNPPTMSVTMVIQMFQDLKKDINQQIEGLTLKVSKLQVGEGHENKTGELEKALEYQDTSITQLQRDMQVSQAKGVILAGTASRQQMLIEELQSKVERLELSSSKRMMTVTGFYSDSKKQVYKKQLQCFINEEMGLDIEIEDAFKLGTQEPEAIVITLPSSYDKGLIYKNIYKIKDIVNKDQRKIFFRDYTPKATAERRRREQDIMDEMQERPALQQKEVKFTKKGLTVDSEAYNKQVQIPDPTSIIQMPVAEIEKIMNIKMTCSNKITRGNSDFIAYTLAACTTNEVNEAYMKVKLEHPGARHVVAVWNLAGIKRHENADYQDDGELGAGRACLQALKDYGINNRAFFIVRYYGGTRLGNERFDCYKMAIKNVLEKCPVNKYTQQKQTMDGDLQKAPADTGAGAQPRTGRRSDRRQGSWRGRGSGRGRNGGQGSNDRPKRQYMSRGRLGGCPIFRVLGQLRQALKNWPFSGSTQGVLPTPAIIKSTNPSRYNDKRYPQDKLQRGAIV